MIRKNRTQREVQTLTGQRGNKGDRAILWRELEHLSLSIADALANHKFGSALSRYINAASIDPFELEKLLGDSNALFEVNQLINNTNTYISNVQIEARASISDARISLADAKDDLQLDIDNLNQTLIQTRSQLSNVAQDLITMDDQVGNNTAGLSIEAAARVAGDNSIAGLITTLRTRVGDNEAAIQAEEVARSDGDGALASMISQITATGDASEAAIDAEATVRANADTALGQSINALTTRVGNNEGAISDEQTARANADSAISSTLSSVSAKANDNRARINTEKTARVNADNSIASSVSSLTTRMGSNEAGLSAERIARSDGDSALAALISQVTATGDASQAAINAEASVRADADNALASDITTLNSQFGSVSASVTQNSAALATMEGFAGATYTMRVNAGGATAKFEIVAADDPINGPATAMKFDADDVIYTGTIHGQLIKAKAVRTNHIVIDEALHMNAETSAFSMSKRGVFDNRDGVFMGRALDASNQIGFGFAISRAAGTTREQYLELSQYGGFRIKNADFLIGSSKRSGHTINNSRTINISNSTKKISLSIIAAGYRRIGSAGNSLEQGGTTTVQLFDGGTLKASWDSAGQGPGAPFAPLGVGQVYQNRRRVGGGGEQIIQWAYTTHYAPNGKVLNVNDYNIESWANPKIVIITRTQGMNNGGVFYSLDDAAVLDIEASPVGRTVIATGILSVNSGATVNFPNTNPTRGMWVVNKPSDVNIWIPGNTVYDASYSGSLTFVSAGRPQAQNTSGANRAIPYRFYPM